MTTRRSFIKGFAAALLLPSVAVEVMSVPIVRPEYGLSPAMATFSEDTLISILNNMERHINPPVMIVNENVYSVVSEVFGNTPGYIKKIERIT